MKGYLDAKELESYKKEDLQELAKQLGVDAEGTKKEIAARCAAVEVDIPDDSELTEEDKKAAAEAAAKAEEEKAAAEAAAKAEEEKAAAEAAAKAEEEKKVARLVKVKVKRRFRDMELNQIKDTRWLLTLLINEALLAEDENAQLLEEKRVGRLIHAGNLQEVQNAIFKSFYRGTAGDNSDTENENDGEETTEEGNRAAVQEN